MTDREMLEFAAKAAGYDIYQWSDKCVRMDDNDKAWNPLKDDGDALRLAVKLNMSLEKVVTSRGCAWIADRRYEGVIYDDSLAAARNAITSAAAEIGKRMP